jgi:hypothetical protein
MRAHGELTYCPRCGKEVYPASEACKHCGYTGEDIDDLQKRLSEVDASNAYQSNEPILSV